MGDRSNVYFPDEYGESRGVYLYAHWMGLDLFEAAREALGTTAARSRWHDGAYLNRIVIQHILTHHASAAHDAGTGWGISTHICDNEYPILVVNVGTERVYLAAQGQETHEPTGPTWTFAEFVGLDKVPVAA